jgi:transposase InsO family protein
MDRGGEFTFGSFTAYCTELGVEHHLTAPYSPQQNGVIERRNQMIVGNLLKAKRVPGEFWGEAVPTPVFILHRLSAKSRKPDVHFMRTFSCVVHVRETRPS